jgi:hypothetical protein
MIKKAVEKQGIHHAKTKDKKNISIIFFCVQRKKMG